MAPLALALLLAASAHGQNVLVIVADDLGVDYVGAYSEGTNPPPTPHIDALAQRGVLFRNAWANPSCSPTRAGLFTGRYPSRTYVGRWIGHWASPQVIGLLRDSEWTLPELLDRAGTGHAHALVGKWHLHDSRAHPDVPRSVGGFDHFAGSLEGQIPSYTSWTRVENGISAPTSNYCTTQNTDDALAWIGAQTGPWVCVLTYQAPHIPYHAPPAHLHTQNLAGLTPSSGHTPANRPFYRAMVESLDTEMGRLFATLGNGVLDQTDVVFFGDNGSVQRQAVAPFDPDRAKGTPYEGGINVPMIVAGPSVTAGGREVTALTCAVDVFSTVLELCGAQAAVPEFVEIDGVSLVPYLQDPAQPPLRQFAFCEQFNGTEWPAPNQNGFAVIRDDRFKLIRRYTAADEMFDLVADPFENVNLLTRALSPQAAASLSAMQAEISRLRTPAGAFTPYGTATCAGSNGVPTISATGTPRIGGNWSVDLASAAPSAAATLLTGLSAADWHGVPLPISLQTIGAGPGCALWTSSVATALVSTSAAGTGSVPFSLPAQIEFATERIYHQWVVLDPSAPLNPLGVVTTQGAASVIGL